jgi:hypothetical protein
MCSEWPISTYEYDVRKVCALLNFNEGKEQLHRCLGHFFTLELPKLIIMPIKIENLWLEEKPISRLKFTSFPCRVFFLYLFISLINWNLFFLTQTLKDQGTMEL